MNTIDNNSQISPYILTADVGGSHITAAVCRKDTISILPESTTIVQVDSEGTAQEILSAWERALKTASQYAPELVTGLAVAMPGPFDYENGISYITGLNKYEALYSFDIKTHLSTALRLDPQLIKFRNDAESSIAGESLAGAGKGYHKVVGVTLGTGFGSAFCDDGITKDLNLGSNVFQKTIADDYLSTRWFLKRYQQLTGTTIANVKELASRISIDGYARQVFEEFGTNMASFLAHPLKELSPDVLILGGNIAKAFDFFSQQLQSGLPEIKIKINQLGETAALIGAAALFEQER